VVDLSLCLGLNDLNAHIITHTAHPSDRKE
jgi:hypothetical protein